MIDLKQFIRDLNETWKSQRYDDLHRYFHEKVVMLPPGSNPPIVGIESMIEGYKQFGSMCTIYDFKIIDLEVYNFESVAMCHMQFDVDYQIESGRYQEKGIEVYAIETSSVKPKIVWRTQFTLNSDKNE